MYITTLQQYQTKAQDATPFMVISLHNELLQVCMYIRGKDVIRTGKNNQSKAQDATPLFNLRCYHIAN